MIVGYLSTTELEELTSGLQTPERYRRKPKGTSIEIYAWCQLSRASRDSISFRVIRNIVTTSRAWIVAARCFTTIWRGYSQKSYPKTTAIRAMTMERGCRLGQECSRLEPGGGWGSTNRWSLVGGVPHTWNLSMSIKLGSLVGTLPSNSSSTCSDRTS